MKQTVQRRRVDGDRAVVSAVAACSMAVALWGAVAAAETAPPATSALKTVPLAAAPIPPTASPADASDDMSAGISADAGGGVDHQRRWPAMWLLSDDDTRIHLFGTLHLVPTDVAWRSPLLESVLADAEVLVLEADIFSDAGKADLAASFRQLGLAEHTAPLSSHFDADGNAWLATWAREVGAAPEALERLRPWAAFLALVQLELKAAAGGGAISAEEGLKRTLGPDAAKDPSDLDPIDMRAGASDAADLRFLETAFDQFSIFARLSDREFTDVFVDALCEDYGDCAAQDAQAPDGATEDARRGQRSIALLYETMLSAWLDGDLDALEPLIDAQAEDDRFAENFHEALYDRRNRLWARKIAQMMRSERGEILVAVGAAHFVNENSLLAELDRLGVSAQRVQ